MLYIVKGDGSKQIWHIGEPSPRNVGSVAEIQADGDELDYIVSYFSVPTTPNKRVIRWFGDDAKFIVANL